MAEAWYCTREDVKRALDIKTTAFANDRVDRAIDSATEDVEGQLRRKFYPNDTTHTFDWLDHQFSLTWRLWLDQREMAVAPTKVLSNSVDITTNVFARPDVGPPFDRLEIDLGTSSMWSAGNTYQRAIAVTGTFGYQYKTASAATLAAALNGTSDVTASLSDSSLFGVGSLLIVGTERLLVTAKNLLTTGTTLGANLDAQAKTVAVTVADGTKVHAGEVITIDAERMLVTDIAANVLVVDRGYDGSVLATHTTGATVYAPRLATVTRAALGTTIASHLINAAVSVFVYPSLVRQLTIAEAATNLIQERAGFARSIGSDQGNVMETVGKGLLDLRKRTFTAHGRKVLLRTAARYI